MKKYLFIYIRSVYVRRSFSTGVSKSDVYTTIYQWHNTDVYVIFSIDI